MHKEKRDTRGISFFNQEFSAQSLIDSHHLITFILYICYVQGAIQCKIPLFIVLLYVHMPSWHVSQPTNA